MQTDERDEGNTEIRRRAQRIAGEHTESAAIRGDRLFQADLHREIGNGGAGRAERHEFLELYAKQGTQRPLQAAFWSGRRSPKVRMVREFYPRSAEVQLTSSSSDMLSGHQHRDQKRGERIANPKPAVRYRDSRAVHHALPLRIP